MSPGFRIVLALLSIVTLCAWSESRASDYTRDGGTADWMCCADKTCSTVISQHADAVRARDACGKLTDADKVTRYTRSNAFRITSPTPAPPTCPAKPADETQSVACPAGTTGSWTQTRTYASAAYPTCWSAGNWTPVTAPAGACVTPPPSGTAKLSWSTPAQNTDGSALTDLAGYRIVYGQSPAALTQSIDVGNVNAYTVTGLPAGTWYFAVITLASNPGAPSNPVSRTL